ncbi:MAG TPA: DUF1629 domain-containing protein [Thermoanaerobaculia bacterium]|nr:DUF1629 domain-containing protein [Thermoanaerobaculia bacterium]
MTIFTVLPSEDAELCHPVDWKFRRLTSRLNGEPRGETWTPPVMELIHEDEGRRLSESDSPWLGSDALIFRPRAVAALGQLLRDNGELLPLVCPEAELWLFNVTNVIDALDQEASQIVRFEDGCIMWIKRHVFRPEILRGENVFKLHGPRVSETFVSDRFVQQWKSSGLKGVEFREVWRPE